MNIHGFLVVRLPIFNFLVSERDKFPRLGEIEYHGVDRHPWNDIFDDAYYDGKLEGELKNSIDLLRKRQLTSMSIDICRDEREAKYFLEYSNRTNKINELIAIRIHGNCNYNSHIYTSLDVEWIGFDFFSTGEWSLIANGLFLYSKYYGHWTSVVNKYGLFDDENLLPEFADFYDGAAREGFSEPVAPDSAGLTKIAIEIGKIHE